jgi:hypothetical protein
LAHHRWAIEQQYGELKDELGLDHFEGRSFVGWHRHVVLTALAYTWLQDARRRAGAQLPTLPVARAVITEILTAHFFVTRPHYLQTMQKLAEINLRIWWSRPQPAVRDARASSLSSNRTCGFPAYGFPRCSPCKP